MEQLIASTGCDNILFHTSVVTSQHAKRLPGSTSITIPIIFQPSTALYLVSDPLPAAISVHEFTIVSHDQGYCDNPAEGSWTWFEVSIIRPWCEGADLDLYNLKSISSLKSRPDDFGDDIQELGWYFKSIPKDIYEGNSTESISIPILTNPISSEWQLRTVTWSKNANQGLAGAGDNLLALLQDGDRLAIWARAQFPGWVNYVKEVRIALSTAATITNSEEDTTARPEDRPEHVMSLNDRGGRSPVRCELAERTDIRHETKGNTAGIGTATMKKLSYR